MLPKKLMKVLGLGTPPVKRAQVILTHSTFSSQGLLGAPPGE